jgi:ATP-dependent exoDNAse (exonuclease V) beta subunit
VLERPERADCGAGDAVRPGLHAPRAGEHRVVWWDPRALALDAVEEVGLRQQRLLQADESGANVEESRRAHQAWQESRRRALEVGAVPALRVATATALAVERAAAAAAVVTADTGVDRTGRPGGRRFGTLVHAALAAAPFDAGPRDAERIAALSGRLVGASEAEVAACAVAVRAALAHPLLARAAAAGEVRRETPLLHALPDGRLCEGVVDLAFRETDATGAARWTVVDFKTDREIGEHGSTYAAQVSLYAEAIAAATGEPAEGVLLVV